jgi:hypothetical protein
MATHPARMNLRQLSILAAIAIIKPYEVGSQ